MIHSEPGVYADLPSGAGVGFTLNRVPDYNQQATVSGINYSVRVWIDAASKMGFCAIDAQGIATATIDLDLPALTMFPDFVGGSNQSLFLNILEYTEGSEITGLSSMGALVIARNGAIRLYIKQDAALTEGSSDTKWFKLQ